MRKFTLAIVIIETFIVFSLLYTYTNTLALVPYTSSSSDTSSSPPPGTLA